MYVQNRYYKILQSSRYDDLESIKSNYKRIIFDNHPDRGGDEDFTKEVNIAWEIIRKYHIQQNRQSDNHKTNNGTKEKHTKNNSNKTRNTTYKHGNSSKNNKTNTKKSNNENNRRCSRCNSKYEKNDAYCNQCGKKIHNNDDIVLFCIGVVLVGIGLSLLSFFWPLGIIYFYLLYKYSSS